MVSIEKLRRDAESGKADVYYVKDDAKVRVDDVQAEFQSQLPGVKKIRLQRISPDQLPEEGYVVVRRGGFDLLEFLGSRSTGRGIGDDAVEDVGEETGKSRARESVYAVRLPRRPPEEYAVKVKDVSGMLSAAGASSFSQMYGRGKIKFEALAPQQEGDVREKTVQFLSTRDSSVLGDNPDTADMVFYRVWHDRSIPDIKPEVLTRELERMSPIRRERMLDIIQNAAYDRLANLKERHARESLDGSTVVESLDEVSRFDKKRVRMLRWYFGSERPSLMEIADYYDIERGRPDETREDAVRGMIRESIEYLSAAPEAKMEFVSHTLKHRLKEGPHISTAEKVRDAVYDFASCFTESTAFEAVAGAVAGFIAMRVAGPAGAAASVRIAATVGGSVGSLLHSIRVGLGFSLKHRLPSITSHKPSREEELWSVEE